MKKTLLPFLLLLAVMVLGASVPTAHAQDTDPPAQELEMPNGFVLSSAHPNPFNPRTTFSLTVRASQEVTVDIFNLLGKPVEQLFNGVMEAGETRQFTFEAGDLPSGIYLYRVQGEDFVATRQVTLLK